jgi:nucleoside-diphosphate-sugar epimerase
MKRILVTGATGFIGSSLLEKLVNSKDEKYELVATGRQIKPWNTKYIDNIFQYGDFTKDLPENLKNFDIICMLASQQPNSIATWNDYYNINCRPIIDITGSSNAAIIYISSTSAISEISTKNPQSLYGFSKYIGENLLRIQNNKSISIRFPSVVGKHHYGGIIHDFLKMALNSKNISVYDHGDKYRNFIHVDSCVDLISSCIRKIGLLEKNYFGICAGSSDSWRLGDIANYVISKVESSSKLNLADIETNNRDIFIDNSNAISIFDFEPWKIQRVIDHYIYEMNNEI